MVRGRPRGTVAPCKFCGRQFKRVEHVRRHERTHTHEKPFACECGQTYSRQDLLNRHRRLSHAKEVDIRGNDNEEDQESNVGLSSQGQVTSSERATAGQQLALSDEYDNLAVPNPGHGSRSDLLAESQHDLVTMSQPQNTAFVPLEDSQSIDPNLLFGLHDTDGSNLLWDNFLLGDLPPPTSFFDTEVAFLNTMQAPHHALPRNMSHGSLIGGSTDQSAVPCASLDHEAPVEGLGVRLPSLEPAIQPPTRTVASPAISRTGFRQFSVINVPWKISSNDYQQIRQDIISANHGLSRSYQIPSQHTLSRYLEGYFRGFHGHFPFIHMVNKSAAALGPDLVLSLAAVGAFYRFEHSRGYELYTLAKRCLDQRLDQWNESFNGDDVLKSDTLSRSLRLLQALVVLMALTSWGDKRLMRDGNSIHSRVAMLVREFGISIPEPLSETTWESWIDAEERRRTLWVAYSLFNLQCVAFNVPPLILNQEVHLTLPSCANSWEARDATEWAEATYGESLSFQDVLHQLLSGTPIHRRKLISAFGNYVLIQGIFQQVFFAQLGCSRLSVSENSLSPDYVKSIEMALRLWQESWEATYESTLDPASPKGPLGFNATALLRLVYIRLNTSNNLSGRLISHNPSRITHEVMMTHIGSSERSLHMDRAVLQCIHALSVPVRVGIAFVARTQALNWSVQHAICNLECAVLLAQWLCSLATHVEVQGSYCIRSEEQTLLDMVCSLVKETEFAHVVENRCDQPSSIRKLAATVVRMWAQTFEGSQVFSIVHRVGVGLCTLADAIEGGDILTS